MSGRDHRPLRERVADDPRPAAIWLLGAAVLVVVELGALAGATLSLVSMLADGASGLAALWTGGGAGRLAAGTFGAVAFLGLAVVLSRSARLGAITRRLGAAPDRHRGVDVAIVALALAGATALSVRFGVLEAVRPVGTALSGTIDRLADLPTLTSRETIPNRGYRTPDGTWHGTFLGLSPATAWALRVIVVYAYAGIWLAWLVRGHAWFRTHYRRAAWTPRDDVLARLRTHRWGQFGFVVVCLFLVMAVFAPTLGPTTAETNIYGPYSHTIEYFDAGGEGVTEITVGEANLQTRSVGYAAENVGPATYDQFDRYHPFGTLTDGSDLFTFLVSGARISLVIGLLSVAISGAIATAFALISAYYRGIADLILVVTGDTIMGVPRLLLLILLTVLLSDTWLAELYDGGILLALVLAATGWPYLWRSFRGPTLQIAEGEWIDAARSYGQSTHVIMRKHMLPYLVGYLLIYCSMVLGGVILAVAGLSFLGLGITDPTPEWGRAVELGQDYVATTSWHISLLPGIMITLVVTGFNALGDALRDAVDPRADDGSASESVSSRGGGV